MTDASGQPVDDRPQCPFFSKVGACRYGKCTHLLKASESQPDLFSGPACSRSHLLPAPGTGITVLLANMHQDPLLVPKLRMRGLEDEELAEEVDENALNKNFLEFFEDTHEEFQAVGDIVQFKVCKNMTPHLRGNVYIQYSKPEQAVAAVEKFNNRFFGGIQLSCLIVSVPSWKQAICGTRMCPKGEMCNFLHVFQNPNGLYKDADNDFEEPGRDRHRDRDSDRFAVVVTTMTPEKGEAIDTKAKHNREGMGILPLRTSIKQSQRSSDIFSYTQPSSSAAFDRAANSRKDRMASDVFHTQFNAGSPAPYNTTSSASQYNSPSSASQYNPNTASYNNKDTTPSSQYNPSFLEASASPRRASPPRHDSDEDLFAGDQARFDSLAMFSDQSPAALKRSNHHHRHTNIFNDNLDHQEPTTRLSPQKKTYYDHQLPPAPVSRSNSTSSSVFPSSLGGDHINHADAPKSGRRHYNVSSRSSIFDADGLTSSSTIGGFGSSASSRRASGVGRNSNRSAEEHAAMMHEQSLHYEPPSSILPTERDDAHRFMMSADLADSSRTGGLSSSDLNRERVGRGGRRQAFEQSQIFF
ncbi:U2 small nuclear ribonucleoprotein auxiliary factor 35 kDa subunit- protein 2 [Podochytrium sp. JEL0797]|nr:U2 small nuclear ribonucleoprotein auxiliary factor 35 kDa subunit- protein 2 [Podochytrium sp. JEL0797]